MLSTIYTKHGRIYKCLVSPVVVFWDPENTHYVVMQDLYENYPPFLVDLSSEPDFRPA